MSCNRYSVDVLQRDTVLENPVPISVGFAPKMKNEVGSDVPAAIIASLWCQNANSQTITMANGHTAGPRITGCGLWRLFLFFKTQRYLCIVLKYKSENKTLTICRNFFELHSRYECWQVQSMSSKITQNKSLSWNFRIISPSCAFTLLLNPCCSTHVAQLPCANLVCTTLMSPNSPCSSIVRACRIIGEPLYPYIEAQSRLFFLANRIKS